MMTFLQQEKQKSSLTGKRCYFSDEMWVNFGQTVVTE